MNWGIVGAIYVVGAIVGLVCWLPFYFGNRRWVKNLREAHREQYDQTVRVHGEFVDKSRELSRVAGELQTAAAQRDRLKARCDELLADVARRDSTIVDLRGEIATLRQELESATATIAELREGLAAMDADFQEQKRQWSAERQHFETRVTELDGEIVRLRGEIDQLQSAAETSRVERVGLEAALAGAKAERDSLRDELETLRAEAGAQTEAWRGERRRLEAELDGAKEEKAAFAGQLDEKHARLGELEHDLAQRRDEIAALNDQISQSDRAIHELRSQLAERSDEAAALNAQLGDKNHQIEKLHAEMLVLTRPAASESDSSSEQKEVIDNLGRSARVTIGVDFGTHSTKVVFRANGDSTKSWVVQWDKPTSGYPNFASPSLVRYVGERIYFGHRAATAHEGKLYRSLKLDLIAEEEGIKPRGDALTRELVALYLAWVLQSVRDILRVGTDHLSLNVGAPMRCEKDSQTHDVYLRIVHAAWQLAFGDDAPKIENGAALNDLLGRTRHALDADVPPRGERHFEIFAEAVCPIVSLSRDPAHAKTGLVMVADLGAGSTKYSISSIGDFDGNTFPIQCHHYESIPLGGDRFNDIDIASVSLDDHKDREAQLAAEFSQNLETVWKRGFEHAVAKTPSEKSLWDKLHIIEVGGGLRRAILQEKLGQLRQPLRIDRVSDPNRTCTAAWHRPVELAFWDLSMPEIAEDLPLLAVAHGLSIHRQNWPRYLQPFEVETRPPAEKVESTETQKPMYNQS